MRYEKPMVLDLNARARFASGQRPLGCYNGGSATSLEEVCFAGTGAPYPDLTPCYAGDAPAGSADCLGGTSAFYCSGGSGGNADPDGCRTGPVVG